MATFVTNDDATARGSGGKAWVGEKLLDLLFVPFSRSSTLFLSPNLRFVQRIYGFNSDRGNSNLCQIQGRRRWGDIQLP